MVEQPAGAGRGDVSKLGVLLAEDDDFTRMMLQRLLEDLGLRAVLAAADGDEALKLLEERPQDVDVVICDLEMPGRGGLELLLTMRSLDDGRFAELPVIVLTAHREAEVVQQAIVFGIAGYLVKPVSKQELVHRLTLAAGSTGAGAA